MIRLSRQFKDLIKTSRRHWKTLHWTSTFKCKSIRIVTRPWTLWANQSRWTRREKVTWGEIRRTCKGLGSKGLNE